MVFHFIALTPHRRWTVLYIMTASTQQQVMPTQLSQITNSLVDPACWLWLSIHHWLWTVLLTLQLLHDNSNYNYIYINATTEIKYDLFYHLVATGFLGMILAGLFDHRVNLLDFHSSTLLGLPIFQPYCSYPSQYVLPCLHPPRYPSGTQPRCAIDLVRVSPDSQDGGVHG